MKQHCMSVESGSQLKQVEAATPDTQKQYK
jgi:hypothetical protein